MADGARLSLVLLSCGTGCLQHADLAFIEGMEQARCYLPPPDSEAWKDPRCAYKAAMSRKDSVAKLRWLVDRGATLERQQGAEPVQAAAYFGNVEAVQFLLQQRRARNAPGPGQAGLDASLLGHALGLDASLLGYALGLAVRSGSIPLASLLRQQGAPLEEMAFVTAARKGDLPVVRWLLEAGCPRGAVTLGDVAGVWPIGCTADGEGLLAAVRLLAAAGWRAGGEEDDEDEHPLVQAAYGAQPYSVWRALQELLPASAQEAPGKAAFAAAASGCVATLEGTRGGRAGGGRAGGGGRHVRHCGCERRHGHAVVPAAAGRVDGRWDRVGDHMGVGSPGQTEVGDGTEDADGQRGVPEKPGKELVVHTRASMAVSGNWHRLLRGREAAGVGQCLMVASRGEGPEGTEGREGLSRVGLQLQ